MELGTLILIVLAWAVFICTLITFEDPAVKAWEKLRSKHKKE